MPTRSVPRGKPISVNTYILSTTAVTTQPCWKNTVTEELANKIPLSTGDYRIRNIRLDFHVDGDRVEYIFSGDAEFYIFMFGHYYPTVTQRIELTGYHNTKF